MMLLISWVERAVRWARLDDYDRFVDRWPLLQDWFDAPLRLRLLYLDESGAPVTAERTDEAAAPVPGDVTTARAACLSPSLRPSGTGLELTVPVELTVERSRRCTWDAITAAELTEPEPGRRPSLVLCRPKKGESLWELAKRYRTDEQAICAANGLEQETPLPSGLLLIPRVR